MGTVLRMARLERGFQLNQQRVVHLDHLLQQRMIVGAFQRIGRGTGLRQTGAAQRLDVDHAGLTLIQRPLTEIHAVDRHQGVDQLEHVRGEVIIAGACYQLTQLPVEVWVFHITNAAGQIHILHPWFRAITESSAVSVKAAHAVISP
ncbi:hypothetical protein D3C78_1541840 [compost metagenome]